MPTRPGSLPPGWCEKLSGLSPEAASRRPSPLGPSVSISRTMIPSPSSACLSVSRKDIGLIHLAETRGPWRGGPCCLPSTLTAINGLADAPAKVARAAVGPAPLCVVRRIAEQQIRLLSGGKLVRKLAIEHKGVHVALRVQLVGLDERPSEVGRCDAVGCTGKRRRAATRRIPAGGTRPPTASRPSCPSPASAQCCTA